MFYGGTSRMTGLQSTVEVASIIALKSKFVYKNRTPTLTNRNLFRRDLGLCAYCGHKFSEKDLTKDHIHPVSKGGGTTWTNCVTACTRCNNKKDAKTLDQANSFGVLETRKWKAISSRVIRAVMGWLQGFKRCTYLE
jgi:5-methylcytosine-specific restriction endonuclease McrA